MLCRAAAVCVLDDAGPRCRVDGASDDVAVLERLAFEDWLATACAWQAERDGLSLGLLRLASVLRVVAAVL